MKAKTKKVSKRQLKKLEQGVTQNAPAQNLASYKMITLSEEETINSQGS